MPSRRRAICGRGRWPRDYSNSARGESATKVNPGAILRDPMARGVRRGWSFHGNRATAARLPVAREATIVVAWRSGGFTVHGSPWDLEAFAVGHLLSEGFVPSFDVIRSVSVRRSTGDRIRVDVRLTRTLPVTYSRRDNVVWGRAPARRAGRGRARGTFAPGDLLALARILRAREAELRAEGPLHWAALYDPSDGRVLLASDLSRHSAIDKVLGKAVLAKQAIAGRILYSSGRVGEEMTAKAARLRVPALATRSVPFGPAADLADRAGILLVGRLRPDGFLVYAGRDRLRRSV